MKSFAALAFVSICALGTLSIGCAAAAVDTLTEDEPGSSEPVSSAEQSIGGILVCDDLEILQFKIKDCPGASPNVTCTRECVVERHFSILLGTCVNDTTTCESTWTCPACN